MIQKLSRTLLTAGLVAGTVALASPAAAQDGQGRLMEYGVDAALILGLGDQEFTQLSVPASRFRAAFYSRNNPQWALEPAVGFGYSDAEGADGVFTYNVDVGVLYHFNQNTAGASPMTAAMSGVYARPFVNLSGFSSDGSDDNQFSIGAGLGVKVPWQERLAWRFEGNVGYGFDNEVFRLGALAGLSFFTR